MLAKSETFRNSIGLSLFRCILAALVMKNMIFYYPIADSLFGKDAIVDYGTYLDMMRYPIFKYLHFPFYVPHAPQAFILISFVAAFLYFFGIFRQVTGLVLWILLLIMKQRNGFIMDGSDNVIEVTLPLLIFADAYKYNSYGYGWLAKLPGIKQLAKHPVVTFIGDTVARYAALALLIQICFVYFFTAIEKMQGDLWLNGTATYYTMRVDEFRQTDWNILLTENHYFVVLSTYFTVIWELSFVFLVWFRQTKWVVLVCGILLHVGIWLFMRIDNFSWIMIGSYAMFVTNLDYARILAFVKRWAPAPLRSLLGKLEVEPEPAVAGQLA